LQASELAPFGDDGRIAPGAVIHAHDLDGYSFEFSAVTGSWFAEAKL
jgi:hypothetical protein